jgi:hypothetical protein
VVAALGIVMVLFLVVLVAVMQGLSRLFGIKSRH